MGCPVGVWVRRTRADPGFVGRLFTKPRNGLVTDVRLITLMEWSSVTNRNCAGSATRDNSLPSRTACAACDPWPAEGLAMTMLRWVLIRHRHRVWGVKDVATHRSTISGGDLSTVSGLIGQRSCGNVVVRGVNDVVTQDTSWRTSRDRGPARQHAWRGLFASRPARRCALPAEGTRPTASRPRNASDASPRCATLSSGAARERACR